MAPSQEYSGVYTSTPDEDYFTPCGISDAGDAWTLTFEHDQPEAPFLKQVTAIRGYPPLNHFIRIRGRPGATGRYNRGFQTRELLVDSVLSVSESIEPCEGYRSAPDVWSGVPYKGRNIIGIGMSADRSLTALMDNERQISIWATDRGEVVKKFPSLDKGDAAQTNNVQLAFSPDNKRLAVGGIDGTVRVWDPVGGKRIFTLVRNNFAPEYNEIGQRAMAVTIDLAFNKAGTMLAATNHISTMIWSMKDGLRLAEFNRGRGYFSKVFFIGDGLLVTGDSSRMNFYPRLEAPPVPRTGTRARATEHTAISPDQRWLAVQGWGDTVYLWSVAEGISGPALGVPGFGSGGLAFSPDGNTIATAGGSNGLYLWDTRTGAPIVSFHNYPGPISHAWFSADGRSIISLSTFDDQVRVVHLARRDRAVSTSKAQEDSASSRNGVAGNGPMAPRTVGVIVGGPNARAVADAEVSISNGDAPGVVLQRATTSSGGYASFTGIRFRHVIIRARKAGFENGVKYIHLMRWSDDGPWGVELKPGVTLPESGGALRH